MYSFILEGSGNIGNLYIPSNENPIGWDDISIEINRHPIFHGIFPEISTKLKFYGSSYDYLYNAYELKGINAEVYIRILYTYIDTEIIEEIFYGKLDFSDIEFTHRYVSINIKSSSCIDLFLDRTDVSVNLYDEPCYDELTFDKTAKRTRYVFAPYLVTFPEKTILGAVAWELDPASTQVINKFSLDGGLGCSLIISSDPSVPAYEAYCGNTDPSENNTNSLSQFQNSNGDYIYYIINGVQLISLVDDLNFINEGFAPQHFSEQYQRDCGNTALITEEPWDSEFEWNGELADCSCCGTYCDDYVLEIDVVANMSMCVEIIEGVVEWFTWIHELVLQWGDNEYILQANPLVADTNACVGWDDTEQCNDSVNDCVGTPGCLSYSGTITIPGCDVKAGDKFRIITRTAVGFKAGGALAGNSNLSVLCTTDWVKCDGRMVTKNCIPDAARVGETNVYSYAIHESFSRLVEYYTNNCLRVKSDYFSRPNSFLGADDETYQCPDSCDEQSYGGYGEDIFCCESTYVYDRNYFLTQCSSTHIPPAIPPTPCTDFILDQPIPFGSFARNDCNYEMMDGCIEVTVPGVYEISLTLNIDNSNAHVAYFNSNNSFSGAYLQTFFYLTIGLDVYVPYSYTAVSTGSGCQTGSDLPINIFNPLTVQKTFTQSDIDLGNNKICLTVDMLATSDVISCSEGEASMSAFNEFTLKNGILNITKIDCELPPIVEECFRCPTFDPSPYQSCDENGGCGAWTILTSGINLRQFGTAMFTSFDELFSSMSAIHNVGVGYSYDDPSNLRIEAVEYFYNKDNVILIIESLDKHKSKYKRTAYTDAYYSKIKSGYKTWLQDKVNTIDAFHTEREYSVAINNIKKEYKAQSEYIADGYAIEFQRRQRWTANSELDDEKFVICVGGSTDPDNTNCYGDPDSMYRVEIGVDMPFTSDTNPPFYAPDGFIDPDTIYNWRISPTANTVRHLNMLKSTLYRTDVVTFNFSKGEANFVCGGTEVCTNLPCDVGYDYENGIEQVWLENEDIDIDKFNIPRSEQLFVNDIIEFEYAITIQEFLSIKNNMYGVIIVEEQSYFILNIIFNNNDLSRFKLIKAWQK